MIFLCDSEVNELIDAPRDELLVRQSLPKHIHRRLKFGQRLFNRHELYLSALVIDVIVDFHCVHHLFLVLHHEPIGKPFQSNIRAVSRHGHI